ncbi:McrC family protein [Aequorivita sinensis]|uniref:McrC family protein n=1 Tax=Aequorivita sinensis TaxID=1382458 RepID=UPI0023015000|nr:McrC family protein [Aequorivita sinensis]
MRKNYEISEYGVIRSREDYDIDSSFKSLKELYLPKEHFNDLFEFIMQNQEEKKAEERMFSIFSKGKKRQIKTKNYVGVIETSKGLTLEILPKIFFDYSDEDYNAELLDTKKVFLKMLSKLKNSPFLNISSAHLKTSPSFPLLEVFIENYITEIKKIIRVGLKSKYVAKQENLNFLKGKIVNSLNIKHNHSNKARFYCAFDEFSNNMVYNQLIKSTLLKLNRISKSHYNRTSILQLLHQFDLVTESTDYISDFRKVSGNNRLFLNYKQAISWSEVFLMNKSFTNFSGNSKNMAILFPMERIFEDYVGYLMKTYADGHEIKTQDKSYYLVSNHKGTSKFRLKPDIVATNKANQDQIIFDTKWKLLDESKEKKNYEISQSDMYQLYAYGKKYNLNNSFSKEPKLVLIYPSNPNFQMPLNDFRYEGDLVLQVIPFNLKKSISKNEEENEIKKILNITKKPNLYDYQQELNLAAEDLTKYGN